MIAPRLEYLATLRDDGEGVLVIGDGVAAQRVGEGVALATNLGIVRGQGFQTVEGFVNAEISRREEYCGDIQVTRGNVAPVNRCAVLVGLHRRGTAERYEGEKNGTCGGKDVDESTNHADIREKPATNENAQFTNRQPTVSRATPSLRIGKRDHSVGPLDCVG